MLILLCICSLYFLFLILHLQGSIDVVGEFFHKNFSGGDKSLPFLIVSHTIFKFHVICAFIAYCLVFDFTKWLTWKFSQGLNKDQQSNFW